ncbi:hypothetical protein [Marinobacter salicampi]|uniref:hypothetical protein n=1 Tax=Marinobacter salicampi TaxID=435907 RepID=UPI001409CD3B|nr:hypothetical protein [Marinobacter salicampi]
MLGKLKAQKERLAGSVKAAYPTEGLRTLKESSQQKLKSGSERVNESFRKVSQDTSKSFSEQKRKTSEVMQKHWPVVEKLLVEGLLGTAEEKLRDTESVVYVFDKVYEALPMAIRLLVGRDKFIGYCVSHQAPLLEKIDGYRAEKEAAGLNDLALEGPM